VPAVRPPLPVAHLAVPVPVPLQRNQQLFSWTTAQVHGSMALRAYEHPGEVHQDANERPVGPTCGPSSWYRILWSTRSTLEASVMNRCYELFQH